MRKVESNAVNIWWFGKKKKLLEAILTCSVLEAERGTLDLKKSSVSKLIEIKEKYNLCDILEN